MYYILLCIIDLTYYTCIYIINFVILFLKKRLNILNILQVMMSTTVYFERKSKSRIQVFGKPVCRQWFVVATDHTINAFFSVYKFFNY